MIECRELANVELAVNMNVIAGDAIDASKVMKTHMSAYKNVIVYQTQDHIYAILHSYLYRMSNYRVINLYGYSHI